MKLPSLKLITHSAKARNALKALAAGSALGAASGGGLIIGRRSGAEDTANAMAAEFTKQNLHENQVIANRFKAYNNNENIQLANHFFKKGLAFGVAHAAKQTQAENPSSLHLFKRANEIEAETVFNNEMEKVARGIAGGLLKSLKLVGKSYKQAGKAGKSALKGVKLKAKAKSGSKILKPLRMAKAKRALTKSKKHLSKSGLAVATTGAAGAGILAGKRSRVKRQYTYYS